MPEDPDSDRLLVCRPCVGDEDALADLMGKCRAAMLSIALSYIPSLATAGEVVQDVWKEVLRYRGVCGSRVAAHVAVSHPDQPGHRRWHKAAPQRTSG